MTYISYKKASNHNQINREILQLVEEFKTEYAVCNDKFQLEVESTYKQCAGFMSFDKNKRLAKRKLAYTGIASASGALLLPVVFLGSAGILSPIIVAAVGATLAVGKNVMSSLDPSRKSNALGVLEHIANNALKAAEYSFSAQGEDMQASGFSFGLLFPGLQSRDYRQEVMNRLKDNPGGVVEQLSKYAASVSVKVAIQAYSKMTDKLAFSQEKQKLIPLALYLLLDEKDIGGRHKSLINTGVIQKSVSADVKDLKSEIDILDKKTSFAKQFAKFGNNSLYDKWFANGDERVTRNEILIEKARIISHAPEYIESLKLSFGDMFAKHVIDAVSNILPSVFTKDFNNKTQTIKVLGFANSSEHRKDFALGMYAFHAVLIKHLGTYNLASLGGFGFNNALDVKVHNALIDALATQAWVTSQAYTGVGMLGRSSQLTFTGDMWEANVFNKIAELPYIKAYFDVDVYWKKVGMAIGAIIISKHMQVKKIAEAGGNFDSKVDQALEALVKIDKGDIAQLKVSDIKQKIENDHIVEQIKKENLEKFSFVKYMKLDNNIIGAVDITDEDLYGMMATGKKPKQDSKDLIKCIGNRFKDLYSDLMNESKFKCEQYISEGLQLIGGHNAVNDSYLSRMQSEFELAGKGINSRQGPKELQDYIDGKEVKIKNFVNASNAKLKIKKTTLASAYNLSDLQSAEKEINEELVSNLKALQLGVIASASGTGSATLQSDINKAVAETLQLLAYKLGAFGKIADIKEKGISDKTTSIDHEAKRQSDDQQVMRNTINQLEARLSKLEKNP
ncbi:hypothetical protein F6R98_00435 [Candidatus Methylospira mobilis]|uniref:Uncharacterized protein n=1 Tax=Candidatus Methylospira mobilis TaxID=1808979 RepID=A0A5Q0BGL7_9GAMM|nr:hypothetical protein [Candidatus Methylospira mobilis]QFY41268.1 hypothetical protein F6R98_00435 [Candidatus Methylospira mobilis]WNV05510.1 hypothetical protein RP726_03610 [Candidatus Methylospira mobilis]